MKVFLIGDVQACYQELCQLLDQMAPGQHDQIWFCGDLVGRGPRPLEVMRLIVSLPNAQTVLGNHDLHFLAIAAGVRDDKPSLRLKSLLLSRQCEEFVHWLRHRPLALALNDIVLVHACVHPSWREADILALSDQLSEQMQSPDYASALKNMYGDHPTKWCDSISGTERFRILLNIFTRARYFLPGGQINLARDNGPLDGAADDPSVPWYELANQRMPETLLFFGHWSALADYNVAPEHGVFHLDKGCVWGNRLFGVEVSWDEQAPGLDERKGDHATKTQSEQALSFFGERTIRAFSVKAIEDKHS